MRPAARELLHVALAELEVARRVSLAAGAYAAAAPPSTAGARKLSFTLLQRQLLFLAHVGRKSDNDPIRCSVFKPNSWELKETAAKRKRGRPRLTWNREVHKHAAEACSVNSLSMSIIMKDDISSMKSWKRAVQHYVSTL